MKRIILFRFHKHPLICKNRLKILKKLNPKIPIYGLYGGDKKDFKKYEQILNKYLVNIYQIKGKSSFWKWKNSDFAIGKWYREIGKSVTFDMVYIIEWDLLLLSSVNNIYRNIVWQKGNRNIASKYTYSISLMTFYKFHLRF